jgi:hypothetical protein
VKQSGFPTPGGNAEGVLYLLAYQQSPVKVYNPIS